MAKLTTGDLIEKHGATIRGYHKQGLSGKEMARRLHIRPQSIYKVLHAYGIGKRREGGGVLFTRDVQAMRRRRKKLSLKEAIKIVKYGDFWFTKRIKPIEAKIANLRKKIPDKDYKPYKYLTHKEYDRWIALHHKHHSEQYTKNMMDMREGFIEKRQKEAMDEDEQGRYDS